jgi:hypothetical protein
MYATMPWGRFKGWQIRDVPSNYLTWVLEEADAPAPWLLDAIEAELARRFCAGCRRSASPWQQTSPPSSETAGLADKVQIWFSRLALHFHPDRGGSDEQMRVVNEAHSSLRELLNIER